MRGRAVRVLAWLSTMQAFWTDGSGYAQARPSSGTMHLNTRRGVREWTLGGSKAQVLCAFMRRTFKRKAPVKHTSCPAAICKHTQRQMYTRCCPCWASRTYSSTISFLGSCPPSLNNIQATKAAFKWHLALGFGFEPGSKDGHAILTRQPHHDGSRPLYIPLPPRTPPPAAGADGATKAD